MFDRSFFTKDFQRLIDAYSERTAHQAPVVEFQLRDGTRYRVENIELVGEGWISFRVNREVGRGLGDPSRSADQITCAYGMLSRIDFLPLTPEAKVGFRISK